MTYEIAHIVLVPFLWIYGYDSDPDSITNAHDAIEVQRREAEKEDISFYHFVWHRGVVDMGSSGRGE